MTSKREEYLGRLEELKGHKNFRSGLKIHRAIKNIKYSDAEHAVRNLIQGGENELGTGNDSKHRMAAVARRLMRIGQEEGDYDIIFRGAKFYEEIGKGNKAIRKLLKSVESLGGISGLQYANTSDFINRNAPDEESGLAGRVSVFALSIIGGIALSVSSLSTTGNAIGNLSGTSQGLGGVFLFVFGLVGLVFSLRRK